VAGTTTTVFSGIELPGGGAKDVESVRYIGELSHSSSSGSEEGTVSTGSSGPVGTSSGTGEDSAPAEVRDTRGTRRLRLGGWSDSTPSPASLSSAGDG